MNNDMQKRLLLATLVSIVFFIAYDFLMPKPQYIDINKTQNSAKEAPSVKSIASDASVEEAPVVDSNIIAKVVSDNFDLEIDSLGRINQVYLKSVKFQIEGHSLPLFKDNVLKPLELRLSNKELNKEAFEINYVADREEIVLKNQPQRLVLTQNLSNLTITKTITFYPSGAYDLNVNLSEDKRYFITTGFRPDVMADALTFYGALFKEFDDTLTMIDDGDAIANQTFNNIKFAASVDRYYASVLYDIENRLNAVLLTDNEANPLIFIDGKQNYNLKGYIGAKDFEILENINPELTDVVEYGFFTFIAKPIFTVLKAIYDFVGNWGVAIILLTFFVRLILYPLTYKGMVSMQKLKELAPKMKDIQAKYKGDPAKMNAHMMELYKKHGANPMGGCLPLILQIPVFFAIYRVLLNAIELKGAEFMFWSDLSLMDPYFVLPILLGVSMYVHQLITPNNFTDPLQAKVFKFLPVIFTFFFITFPAGLVLYWFVNNIFSIIQQQIINKVFEKKKALEKKANG